MVPLTRGPISLGRGGMLQQSIGRKFPLCGSLHLFEYHNCFYWRMQKEGPNQLEKREPHDDWVLTIGKSMGAIWEGGRQWPGQPSWWQSDGVLFYGDNT